MIPSQEEYETLYDADVSAGKEPEWEKWGNGRRQRCMNRRSYDQWLDCGFKGEPSFDDYGWFKEGRNLEPQEIVTLWSSEAIKNTVECTQLPNGKWISGIHYMLSESGCSSGLSIWNHQYDTRVEALSSPIRSLLEHIKKSGKSRDREHLVDVIRAMDDIKQLNLFW